MMLEYVFGVFCLIVLFYVVVPLCFIIVQYTIGPKLFSKRKQLRNAGKWAIITGASDGIGKALAYELASDGLDLLLLSRTESKLETLAEELRSKYKVSVKYLAVDFTKTDIYDRIRTEIDSLPSIACLVNNVGMVNVDPLEFAFDERMSVAHIQDYINCNCLSMAALTHMVLPRLIAQNSGAAVINFSSFTAIQPLPYVSLYGGTKRFDGQFSLSLEREIGKSKVLVHTIFPMYVQTAMVGRRRGFWVISPAQCARSSLNMLGVNSFCYGHLIHAIQIFYFSFISQSQFNHSMLQKYRRAQMRRAKSE